MASPSAWQPIEDYERYWSPFDARFDFSPEATPAPRRGIIEPADSVTLSLAPIFQAASSGFAAGADALNSEVLRAFVDVFDDDERLVVLDWQHQSYWFWPHVQAISEESWQVTPFPNGDYYIFFNDDMTIGTFGHPWERSLCAFGEPLVERLVPALATWLPVLRRAGQDVAGSAP